MNKTHISLNVANLDQALEFYSNLFKARPAKMRPGYANFDLDNPPLKLALNESSGAVGLSHLGVQVGDSETVFGEIERFRAIGLDSLVEENTDCCHALQDKVWVSDPDGHKWEVFAVKGDVAAPKASGCGCSA